VKKKFEFFVLNTVMADIKTSFHKLDRASATHKKNQQKNQKKFFKLLKNQTITLAMTTILTASRLTRT
jgi:hypothetical protein